MTRPSDAIPDAPVYTATLAEMEDLEELLANANLMAIKYGAVRIDPPSSWPSPPLRMRPKSRFFVRMQNLPEVPFVHPDFIKRAAACRPQPRKRARRKPPPAPPSHPPPAVRPDHPDPLAVTRDAPAPLPSPSRPSDYHSALEAHLATVDFSHLTHLERSERPIPRPPNCTPVASPPSEANDSLVLPPEHAIPINLAHQASNQNLPKEQLNMQTFGTNILPSVQHFSTPALNTRPISQHPGYAYPTNQHSIGSVRPPHVPDARAVEAPSYRENHIQAENGDTKVVQSHHTSASVLLEPAIAPSRPDSHPMNRNYLSHPDGLQNRPLQPQHTCNLVSSERGGTLRPQEGRLMNLNHHQRDPDRLRAPVGHVSEAILPESVDRAPQVRKSGTECGLGGGLVKSVPEEKPKEFHTQIFPQSMPVLSNNPSGTVSIDERCQKSSWIVGAEGPHNPQPAAEREAIRVGALPERLIANTGWRQQDGTMPQNGNCQASLRKEISSQRDDRTTQPLNSDSHKFLSRPADKNVKLHRLQLPHILNDDSDTTQGRPGALSVGYQPTSQENDSNKLGAVARLPSMYTQPTSFRTTQLDTLAPQSESLQFSKNFSSQQSAPASLLSGAKVEVQKPLGATKDGIEDISTIRVPRKNWTERSLQGSIEREPLETKTHSFKSLPPLSRRGFANAFPTRRKPFDPVRIPSGHSGPGTATATMTLGPGDSHLRPPRDFQPDQGESGVVTSFAGQGASRVDAGLLKGMSDEQGGSEQSEDPGIAHRIGTWASSTPIRHQGHLQQEAHQMLQKVQPGGALRNEVPLSTSDHMLTHEQLRDEPVPDRRDLSQRKENAVMEWKPAPSVTNERNCTTSGVSRSQEIMKTGTQFSMATEGGLPNILSNVEPPNSRMIVQREGPDTAQNRSHPLTMTNVQPPESRILVHSKTDSSPGNPSKMQEIVHAETVPPVSSETLKGPDGPTTDRRPDCLQQKEDLAIAEAMPSGESPSIKRVRSSAKRKLENVPSTFQQDETGRLLKSISFPDSSTPVSLELYAKRAREHHARTGQALLHTPESPPNHEVRNEELIRNVDILEEEFWKALRNGIDGNMITVSYGVDVEAEGAFDSAGMSYVEWYGSSGQGKVSKSRKGTKPGNGKNASGSRGQGIVKDLNTVGRQMTADKPADPNFQERNSSMGVHKGPRSHVGTLNRGGVLRHMPRMPGINHSMYYVGQLFTRFCWHTEDAFLNSVSYLHPGSAEKIWYAIPPRFADNFEQYAAAHVFSPELLHDDCSGQTLLMNKTTIFDPREVRKTGIEVYRVVHKPGSFVLTAPRAYHAGFNCGFNVAEAVNFANPTWFPVGRDASSFARRAFRPLCVPWEYLLFHEAKSIHDIVSRGPSGVSRPARVVTNAKVVARELRSIIVEGERKVFQYAKAKNCRVSMLNRIEIIAKNNQVGPEFGSGAGMVCSLCAHTCHFYAEMCGSCDDSFEARCVDHFGKGHRMCLHSSHKTIIVRRHDPVLLLDILSCLERIAEIAVDPAELLERYTGYVRTWQTPLKSSGLRLRLDLKAAVSRRPPKVGKDRSIRDKKVGKDRGTRDKKVGKDRGARDKKGRDKRKRTQEKVTYIISDSE